MADVDLNMLSQPMRDLLSWRFPKEAFSHPGMESIYAVAVERMIEGINLPGHNHSAQNMELAEIATSTNIAIRAIDPISLVQMEVRLPSVPSVLDELNKAISRSYSTAETVAKVILKDTGLSVWLLRLVNSPFFGFRVKVETVSRAVALIGVGQIQALAVSGALNGLASKLRQDILDINSFWRHSMAVGVAAHEIWRLTGRPEPERLFVAGMLHDVGQLLLAITIPEIYKALQGHIRQRRSYSWVVENELLGFDHAKLGGMLLHRWNLPIPLIMSTLRHHVSTGMERYNEAAVVHMADIIAKAFGAGQRALDPVPSILSEAWKISGMTPEMLPSIVGAMQVRLEGLTPFE